MRIVIGVLIPLLGTVVGAACVFFMWGEMNRAVRSAMAGFAGGIMVAASVWSLLIPAIERCEGMGTIAFLPPMCGLLCGVGFLLLLDLLVPSLSEVEGETQNPNRLTFAVTLHNLPEGMAVGAAFAGVLAGEDGITLTAALVLAVGVAVQNVPEGAIVSMPQRSRGVSRWRAFWSGAMSGAVEPIGAAVTVLAASVIVPLLPFLLGFAAGAMLYVVVEELVPEVIGSGRARVGNVAFILGFCLMMALDVALG